MQIAASHDAFTCCKLTFVHRSGLMYGDEWGVRDGLAINVRNAISSWKFDVELLGDCHKTSTVFNGI